MTQRINPWKVKAVARKHISVKAIDVVKHVRAGMDDASIMEKLGLSSRGLQTVLGKLVKAGLLDKDEMTHRQALTTGSVTLDVLEAKFPEKDPLKPIIDAADALRCIRKGMSDPDLMKRYNISATGLQSLFSKLISAGGITRAELDGRNSEAYGIVQLDEKTPDRENSGDSGEEGNLDAIATSIRERIDFKTLMEAHDLTPDVLKRITKQLVREGAIQREELDPTLTLESRTYQIKSKTNGEVIYAGTAPSLKALVEEAVVGEVDLSGADLQGADLSRSDLSGARMAGVVLRKANLVGADFTGATLTDADISSADMYGAILYKAKLSRANLSDSNLSMVHGVWAFMAEANMAEANMSKANLSGANLARANLFESILYETNLSGAYLSGASMHLARLKDSSKEPVG